MSDILTLVKPAMVILLHDYSSIVHLGSTGLADSHRGNCHPGRFWLGSLGDEKTGTIPHDSPALMSTLLVLLCDSSPSSASRVRFFAGASAAEVEVSSCVAFRSFLIAAVLGSLV
jgi:hypothetical protein